jgi:hypothetical protein
VKELFISPAPEVVGFFDNEHAQQAAEAMVSVAGDRNVVDGVHYFSKLESSGLAVDVHWIRPDIVSAHEPNGDKTETVEFYSKAWTGSEADLWHFDSTEGDQVEDVPCSTLVGASLHPTLFLKGAVRIGKEYCDKETGVPVFTLSDVQEIIDDAIQQGNLEPVPIAEGLVVQAKMGALHRRVVPRDYVGARYFKRHFPVARPTK